MTPEEFGEINARLEALETTSRKMDQLITNTETIIEIFTGGKKIIKGAGHVARWCSNVGIAILTVLALLYAWKTGHAPPTTLSPG